MRRALVHVVRTAVRALAPQSGCAPAPDDAVLTDPTASLYAALSPNPPPASCDQRSSGVTAIQVQVRIDEYQGPLSTAATVIVRSPTAR